MEGISDSRLQEDLNINEGGLNSHESEGDKTEAVERVLTPLEKLLLQQDKKLGLIPEDGGVGGGVSVNITQPTPPTPPLFQKDDNVQNQNVQSNKPVSDPQVPQDKEEFRSPFLNNKLNNNSITESSGLEGNGLDTIPLPQSQPQPHCHYTRDELLQIAKLTDTSSLPNDLDISRLRDLQDATVFRSSSSLSYTNSGIGSGIGPLHAPNQPNVGVGATQVPPPRVGTSQLNIDAPSFRASAKVRAQASAVRSSLLEDNMDDRWSKSQGSIPRVGTQGGQLTPEGIPIGKSGNKQKGWNGGEEPWRADQMQSWSSPKNSMEPDSGVGWERNRGSWERGRGPRPKSGRAKGRMGNDENYGEMHPGDMGQDWGYDMGQQGGDPGHLGILHNSNDDQRQTAMKIEQERLMMQEHFKKQQNQQTPGLQPKEGEMTDMDFENMKREQEEDDRREAMGYSDSGPNNFQQNQMDIKTLLGHLSSAQAGRQPNPAMMNMFNMPQATQNRPPNFPQGNQPPQFQIPGAAQKYSLQDLLGQVKSNNMGDKLQVGDGYGFSNPPRQDSQTQNLVNILRATQEQQQQRQLQQQLNRNPNQLPGTAPGAGGGQQGMSGLMQILMEKQQQMLAQQQQQQQAQALLGQHGGFNAQDNKLGGGQEWNSLQQTSQQRGVGASALDSLLQGGIGNRPQGLIGFQQRQQPTQNPGFPNTAAAPGGGLSQPNNSNLEVLLKLLQGHQQQQQLQQQQQQQSQNAFGGVPQQNFGGVGNQQSNLSQMMAQLQQQKQQLQLQNALRQQSGGGGGSGLFGGMARPGGAVAGGAVGFQQFSGAPNQFGGLGGSSPSPQPPRPMFPNLNNGGLQNLLNQSNKSSSIPSQTQQPSTQDDLLQRLLSLSRQSQQQQQQQQAAAIPSSMSMAPSLSAGLTTPIPLSGNGGQVGVENIPNVQVDAGEVSEGTGGEQQVLEG